MAAAQGLFLQLSRHEKLQEALVLKEEGNGFIEQNNYRNAIKKYHRSLLYVRGLTNQPAMFGSRSREDISEELKVEIERVMCSVYNNLAGCFLKQRQWQKVIDYSTEALEVQPGNAKALFRRGKAHIRRGDYDKAEKDLKEAQKIEPNAACVKKLLVELEDYL